MKKKLLILIHLINCSHWVLVCVDFELKEIQYYYNLGGYNFEVQCTIFNYLNKQHLQKIGKPLLLLLLFICAANWQLVTVINTPHQENGHDCGVFVCTFAEYLARCAIFNFSQRHMKLFRQLIAYELTVKRLLDVNVNAKYIDSFIMSVINSW